MQQNSVQTQDASKKNKSFQLAEAGQDRASWKLRESDSTWNIVAGTGTLINYNNDYVYTDVAGGSYKIKISSGPSIGKVTVISKGMAKGSTAVRAIKGIYSKASSVTGAMLVAGGVTFKPNLDVEWGPIVGYNSMTSPSNTYPRKYCAGQIQGRCTVSGACNGALPAGNWVNYDYAAFQNLGNAPTIDLTNYRNLAKSSCVPLLSGVAPNPGPGGCNSGYYNGAADIPNGYDFRCSTCVIFIEGATSLNNNSFIDVGALCATGDVDFKAKNVNYVSTIPATAQLEYQYAGGGYGSSAVAYWNTTFAPGYPHYTINGCGMHGFLYCGGNISTAAGNGQMCGAVYIAGTISINTFTVYYDSVVGNNIALQGATVTRASWDEILTSW